MGIFAAIQDCCLNLPGILRFTQNACRVHVGAKKMKKVLLLLAGFVVGVAASTLIIRTSPPVRALADLHQSIIETDIGALDSLSKGDEATAKLMLASSVNSNIVVWEKLSSADDKRKDLSEKWRRQMSVYNAQTGLSLPDKRPEDDSKN